MSLEKQQKMAKCLGPYTHIRDLKKCQDPGLARPNPAIEVIYWGVNQLLEDFLSLSACLFSL